MLFGSSLLSCVYGPLDRSDKQAFRDNFSSVGENFDASWLCIGDFNFVLDQYEKLGGRPVARSSHCPFKRFIDHFGMIDLGFVGNPFIWCNNRQGNATIKEHLDCGLATPNWIHLHPKYSSSTSQLSILITIPSLSTPIATLLSSPDLSSLRNSRPKIPHVAKPMKLPGKSLF